MYWPLGIPNYYSVRPHTTATSSTETHDGTPQYDLPSSATNGAAQEYGGDDGDISLSQPPSAAGGAHNSTSDDHILDLRSSRGGQIFATITRRSLSVWQTKPTAVLATAVRSRQSLSAYGDNVALLVRPDALIIVVQTSGGFLITYSLASDPNAQVYQLSIRNWTVNGRRQSADAIRRSTTAGPDYGAGDGSGIRDVSIRFRMVIRIDAGISKAIALDDELMVATTKPAAIQCIRWSPDKSGSSHNTDLLKRMPWFAEKSTNMADMVFDKPMGLHVWLSMDGRAYAVQRTHARNRRKSDAADTAYKGFCFHEPESNDDCAVTVAVNARFSLVAVGCADASIRIYTAKDYLGNIPISHALVPSVSRETSGALKFILHSPDGYCIFAGFENGWATWSVYGKPGATSFASNEQPPPPQHWWLGGVADGFFAGAGAEVFLLAADRTQLCVLEIARAAVAGCFDMANIHRALLQTSSGLMVQRAEAPGQDAQWQTLRFPAGYLSRQWPIRCAVISACGKYIAIAGRRGLAHYSTASGRWKTFDDPYAEDDFTVRGGMCWYQHILVAAGESEGQSQIRLYSREKNLTGASAVFTEVMQSPIIHMAIQDANSLLVYTHENVLLHYVFDASPSTAVRLVQVGQIGFHGIIRAPTRIRSISWIVPDEQREHGDPSHDVAKAAVLFLVDGKLVLLQPSPEEHRELKYDMRVIAHDVEFYLLAREGRTRTAHPLSALSGADTTTPSGSSLHDSLWFFNGSAMHVWPDVHELVSSISSELNQQTLPPVAIGTDFYPLAPLIDHGTLSGLEPTLVHRRDADLVFFRAAPRSHLFIPALLRHYLSRFDSPAALHLSDSYKDLPYFPHALEVLLHDVLDDEVDAGPHAATDGAQLASLLPFLSSFPSYLDIVLGCARKTEIRSWTTLFRHLPPVAQLFEQALRDGKLKTAGGFLLVLHTFDEERFTAEMMARLLGEARKEGDWDLCKELARFLVGVDASGELLRRSLRGAGMEVRVNGSS
ncbi:RIC1-domain-containing protein [Myriangium duriaei CBS 260.36]|uniref:RIC1-domain-containing protein n=1 Tax=Myriangium duriaei CBS 260.36 TaxID=1168546 RepID=A0A9P4J2V3_9PEZI|nr:RIC1-domain-containing protein [Myriangium duriaei CBS 260.36]